MVTALVPPLSSHNPVLCVVEAAQVSVSVPVFPQIDGCLLKYFSVRRDLLHAQRLMLGFAAQSLGLCPHGLVQDLHSSGRLCRMTEGEVSSACENNGKDQCPGERRRGRHRCYQPAETCGHF